MSTGCGGDFTSPYVAVGTFLGVKPDIGEDVQLAMETAELETGAVLDVVISDIRTRDGITTFLPSFRSAKNGEVVLDGEGPSWQTTDLDYVPEPAVLEAQAEDILEIALDLPAAAEVNIPATVGAWDDLSLGVGEGYTGVLVTVEEALTGKHVFDNLPDDANGIVSWATDSCPCEVVIPEGAFQPDGTYLVGVAGLVRAQREDISGFNALLSAFVAGEMDVSLVRVE